MTDKPSSRLVIVLVFVLLIGIYLLLPPNALDTNSVYGKF